MKLFVVESPGKVKKIQGFLGPSWKVMASVGHVRDLPVKEIGVQPPDFVPQYVVTERGARVLKELALAAKNAESVYLATDPDREGEAIAWHLEQTLHLQNARRVTYTEITEKAVQTALEQPRTIDLHLVSAQESRRVLDRLVGYLVSPVLSHQNGTRLSAGRVQSPAVRLVVERERAIRDFRVTQHYGVELSFNDPERWKAFWLPKEGGWLEEDLEYILDKNVAEQIAAIKTVTVRDCQETKSKAAPPAPFVTSTLQQAASASLKISPQRCMELAQKLYENGHITYMRTDSPNLSEEAVSAIRSWAAKNNHLVPASPRVWMGKAGAQEAHEAIRPTHFEIETVNDDPEAQALYRLIRYRALASQLEDAVYALRTLRIEGEVNGKRAVFEAKGRTLLLPGWKALVARDQTEEEEDEPDMQVPQLKAGQELQVQEGKVVSKKTRPPARFTEAALVRELEKRGIGRPSTYAAILDNITHGHGYLTIEKRQLIPTDKGETVVDAMTGAFGFLDYEYTKNMEERLDAIAAGRGEYRPLVTEAYAQLNQEIENYIVATSPKCPVCGKPLVHRQGVKDGREFNFWGCSSFKKDGGGCPVRFADDNGTLGERLDNKPKTQSSEHKCPVCGKPLVHRQGVKNGWAFNFWGCSGFLDGCPATFADDDGKPGERKDTKPKAQLSEPKCPVCGKPLVHRQGVKNGREFNFWGCSGFRDGCLVTFADDDGKPGKRQDKKGKK